MTEEKKDVHLEDKESPREYVFVDLSLEKELKGELLEWFRSRIPKKKKIKKKDKIDEKGKEKKVQIITGGDNLSISEEKPNKFILRLQETNTVWLMSLETRFSKDDLSDAEKVRRENEIYQTKKTKIELIRKKCTADAQTPKCMEKSQGTETAEIRKVDASVWATEWDLHDTYNAFGKSHPIPNNGCLAAEDTSELENSPGGNEDGEESSSEEQIKKLQESSSFSYAALVTERLLASNCYMNEQTKFKTDFVTRYDEEETTFAFDMKLLWSFHKDAKHKTRLMVAALDWNPLNQELLAVGYGDLTFLKRSEGLVCIWSPKNPRQPEREFPMEDSVTCLRYSRLRPNFLAVGTKRGHVYVLDVSCRRGEIRRLLSDDSKPRPHPIWKVEWFLHKELVLEKEELLAVGESGVLTLFSFSRAEFSTDILKLDYMVSKEQFLVKKDAGNEKQWQQQSEELSYDKKTFSGLCFSIFSNQKFCYVSTKEGVLIRCNLRNPSMLTDIFLAHDGPVYTVAHSPTTEFVYLTCGADWNIRIWMEGINEPLITLQNKAPVRCAEWSPTIPTVIASIGDAELSLWDISINIVQPVSTINFNECGKPLSTILFSPNGCNILVGGEDGLVRVIHLSQLPRIPFLQKEALIAAVKNGLNRNKSMIGIFTRMTEKYGDLLKTKVSV